MKPLSAILFAMVCVFSFSGCQKTPSSIETETSNKNIIATESRLPSSPECTETETSNETIIGYIEEIHNETVSFDEIEWVSVPGERAAELGITDDEAPNGFYIHNEEIVSTKYIVDDKCVIYILDWENNFAKKQIKLVDFIDVLEQRGSIPIPYMLTIEDGKVINVEEHYIP